MGTFTDLQPPSGPDVDPDIRRFLDLIATDLWVGIGLAAGSTGKLQLKGLTANPAQGSVLYFSASNTFAALAKDTNATRYLANTGTTNNPQWDQINVANGVTGVLPIANGGTNSSTSLNNNRVIISSSGGIVEAAALTNGELMIGSTGATPGTTTLSGSNGMSITNGAGTISLAPGDQNVSIGQSVSFNQITSTASLLAPFIVNSTTVCTGLNADLLDGEHASAFADASHAHATGDITSGTFTDARVAESNVTQHKAAAHTDVGWLNFASPTELTIASGAVTATQSWHALDTEADAGTDDLDTISGGTEGNILIVHAINNARTVVIKHNTGNIQTQDGADISLGLFRQRVMLIFQVGNWYVLATAF